MAANLVAQTSTEAQDIGLLSKDGCKSDSEFDSQPAQTALQGIVPDLHIVRRQSFVYIAFFISMGLMVGSVGPLMPLIYSNLHVDGDGAQPGADDGANASAPSPGPRDGRLVPVFVARGFGGLAGSLLGGALIERSRPGGAHRVLGAGIFLTAAGTGAMQLCGEVGAR